ncbi:hypothetical protein ACFRH6_18940 [Streptomyces sp. NPDC056749]|uniref:hypothetical protein n=1 Tax=Streptomyces sp. NPDC056749 TaxID=3345936 RepID=UPI00369D15CA
MSAPRVSPAEPWPGWTTSRAAQTAYGKHLVRIGRLIPAVLYTHVMDRQGIGAAYNAGRQDLVDSQIRAVIQPLSSGTGIGRPRGAAGAAIRRIPVTAP